MENTTTIHYILVYHFYFLTHYQQLHPTEQELEDYQLEKEWPLDHLLLKLALRSQGTYVRDSFVCMLDALLRTPLNTLDVAGASTTGEEDVAAATPLHGEL